jgi:hypothetical protein
MLALNAARYGGPLESGYGEAGGLFAWTHVAANLARYPRWLIETQTPIVLLAVAAPWIVRRDPARLRLVLVSLACAVLLVATYLAYLVFDDWWYVRFLVPALPVVLACAVLVLSRVTDALPHSIAPAALRIVIVLLVGRSLDVAEARRVFDLQGLEARFRLAGDVARTWPSKTVVLAAQQSGSVRFHGDRPTLAWDAIPTDALDPLLAWLTQRGHAPVFMLEDGETQPFRSRFPSSEAARLDWPPQVEVHTPTQIRLYDPVQRRAYMAGNLLETRHIRR